MHLRRFPRCSYYLLKWGEIIPSAVNEHKDPSFLQPEIRSDVDVGGMETVQTLGDRNVLLIF